MRICAVVILFNPTEEVISNINSYLNQIDHLLLIDNSEKSNIFIKNFANENSNISIIQNFINEGISKRLNEAITYATLNKFDFLLTMDQDSLFENNYFKIFLHSATSIFLQQDKVAIVGPNVNTFSPKTIEDEAIEVMHLITSGSIIKLKVTEVIGTFDENLFIDEVDTEYCYRAIQKGFKVVQLININMKHSFGTISKGISFKSGNITDRVLHSPIRLYYLTRNFFYVNKRYKKIVPTDRKRAKAWLLISIKNNILYNSKRFQILFEVIKGYYHFCINKMGKLNG